MKIDTKNEDKIFHYLSLIYITQKPYFLKNSMKINKEN